MVVFAWLLVMPGCGSSGEASGPTRPDSTPPMAPEAPPAPQTPQQPETPPKPTLIPLSEDPAARTTPSRDDMRMDRAEAEALMAELKKLPKFPLPLSELEAALGRPMRRYFNPESHDPTFVHDQGGTGANNGGTPLFHFGQDPDMPLLFELRSKYYARYDDERRFRDRPPFAADDPMIDLISISDRYANSEPPLPPSKDVFQGNYAYIAEQWSVAPLHDGFVSLLTYDRTINQRDERWVFQLTVDRGFYNDPAQVDQVETMLLGFLATIRDGKDVPQMLANLEREHASNYDLGILRLGLGSYNVRFFDVDLTEGPHAGEFLRKEGRARALYIDAYIEGDARVPLPRFFEALGFESVAVDPSDIENPGPGHDDGGFIYYNDFKLSRDGWHVRGSGFYPIEAGGKPPTTVDLSRFLVRSLTIRHEVPLGKKK